VFDTSWEKDRVKQTIEEILTENQKEKRIEEHRLEKRIKTEKDRSKGGRGR